MVGATSAPATKLNASVARVWTAGRKLAKAAGGPSVTSEDLDFNTLSASLQAVLAHARRRNVPDTAIAVALGAAVGPILSTVPVDERAGWVDRLGKIILFSGRMTETGIAVADPGPATGTA